jgi:hypothetical protein
MQRWTDRTLIFGFDGGFERRGDVLRFSTQDYGNGIRHGVHCLL